MPTSDGFSEHKEKEYREKVARPTEAHSCEASGTREQSMLEYLIETGFRWDEAITLLDLKENLCENAEMRQRMQGDYRMHFVKWLYEHGIVGEE